ncbi:MAG: ABC transporter permease [Trueperaceae bacterium]|nr:ABC transporter permease [Trueperaceae bacterium]
MTQYLVRRLVASVFTLLIVSLVIFGIVHFTPGDPARIMAGDVASAADVERIRQQLGLDRPIIEQYVSWLGQLVRGDLGRSLFLQRPVAQAIWERAEPTFILTVFALGLAVLIGVPAGIVAAVRRGSIVDQGLAVVALLGLCIPNFWLGMMLILVFAVGFGILPSGGYVPIAEGNLLNTLRYLALPIVTLGFSESALISRITRAAMLDTLGQDYVRSARSKGLGEAVVVGKHALRNAMIPILTVVGLALGVLLGGAVVTETVFTIPGVGRLVVSSIARRDYPVIQGVVLVIAVIYVLVNLLIDLLYTVADPRIRY